MANSARIAWNQKRLQLRKHSRTSWPQRSLIRFVGVGIQPCDGRSRGMAFSALLCSCPGAAIEGRLLGDAFGEPTSA